MSVEDRIERFQERIDNRLKEIEALESNRLILVPVPVTVNVRPDIEK